MEVKDALSLMFMFGMFILALLTYLKKKQTALFERGMRSTSVTIFQSQPPLKAAVYRGVDVTSICAPFVIFSISQPV